MSTRFKVRHHKQNRYIACFFAALALIVLIATGTPLAAQDGNGTLRITGTDVSNIPTVTIYVDGRDANGLPIDLSNQYIDVQQNGERIANPQATGIVPVGTFTVFLLDLTSGVQNEIPDILNVIETYAAVPTMEERTDSVAIYLVDEISAVELLAPSEFHNSVRNTLRGTIETAQTATALYDSLGDLLSRMEGLQPRANMSMSIVVFTDGTDTVSQQFTSESITAKAKELGIPIHSVWLSNTIVTTTGATQGQNFLRELANATGGANANLDNPGLVRSIWERIASYRHHLAISYTLDDEQLLPGEYTVDVTFPDSPGLPSAQTQIVIDSSIPSITIDIPEEDRVVQVASLEEAVDLTFPTSVRWLDGETRGIEIAQLYVNGVPYRDIPVGELSRFTMDVPLIAGENRFQIVMRDETGAEAQSAPMLLNVTEGDGTIIPTSLGGGSNIGSILRWILIAIAFAALFWFVLRTLMRVRTRRGPVSAEPEPIERAPVRKKPAKASVTRASKAVGTVSAEPTVQSTNVVASLEVLDSLSSLATFNDIDRTEFLIGRSPTVDLSFPDDPTVSRIHATIVQDGAIFRVFDEQSTSGTYVNDREVPEYGMQLTDGDEVHLGAVHLRFRLQV